jgi:hypothetical protein
MKKIVRPCIRHEMISFDSVLSLTLTWGVNLALTVYIRNSLAEDGSLQKAYDLIIGEMEKTLNECQTEEDFEKYFLKKYNLSNWLMDLSGKLRPVTSRKEAIEIMSK